MKPFPCLLLSAAVLFAQAPQDWFTKPVLPEHMRRGQMYAHVSASIPPLPRFDSPAAWERYKAALKPRILGLLGVDDVLARHKLRVLHRGTLEREGYRIEKIAYESFPGMYVPALVWVPGKLAGTAPAMVSISGHLYCESKAGDYVQARNYNLVRRGFIVISYDYLGCFERGDEAACAAGKWAGVDHANSLFSYTGRTPTAIELLDGIRAVDYLYSRPDVDRARIGFTGESGGGNNTYWVSALDDRVTLSVPVSAAGAFEQWIKADLNYDWHQRPPGIRALADIGTLYAMMAPKPLLVINGRPELGEFAKPDALRSVAYAREVYKLYGKPSGLAWHESHTGHGYQEDKRKQLYGWLNRHFFGGRMPHGELDLPYTPEPKEALRVGLPEENHTLATLARQWVRDALREHTAPSDAAAAKRFQETGRRSLRRMLGWSTNLAPPGVVFNHGDDLAAGGYQAERLRFEVDRDVLLPAVFARRTGRSKYKVVIVLEKHRGASAEVGELLDRGYAVLALDPRGTGEVDWGGARTSNWANFVGRPPVGIWAEDLSRIAGWLLGRSDVEKVAVLAHGLFGKAALYGMALDPRIAAAAVSTDTLSYRQEATSGLTHIYADVPRILTWGDLPQVAALAAPRPLAVVAAGKPESLNGERPGYFAPLPRFTASGERVADEELESGYGWTRAFYGLFGAGKAFQTGSQSLPPFESAARWLAHAELW